MTINDFLITHYLHDSLVENISYENNSVDISIDFCFWMQKDYRDGDPETGIIHLHFDNVSNCIGPTGDIDDFSILEAGYQDGCFSMLLLDDFNNTSHELKILISSDNIEVTD